MALTLHMSAQTRSADLSPAIRYELPLIVRVSLFLIIAPLVLILAIWSTVEQIVAAALHLKLRVDDRWP